MSEGFVPRIIRKVRETLNPEAVTEQEQLAFQQIAREMIFAGVDFDMMITRENATAVSKMIQKNFLELIENKKGEAKAHADKMFANMIEVTSKKIEVPLEPDQELKTDPEDPTDSLQKILSDFPHIQLRDVDVPHDVVTVKEEVKVPADLGEYSVEIMPAYDGVGFTPKLSLEAAIGKGEIALNCLGLAIKTGAEFIEKGLNPVMLVGADHPDAVLLRDNWIYLNPETKAKNFVEIQDKGYYKIVRKFQSAEGELEKDILFIFPFADAVLYEILENLEVYRWVAMDKPVHLLIGTMDKVVETAQKYSEVLQATDWKALQKKLFPEIAKAIEENRLEFERSIQKVRDDRIWDRVITIMGEAFKVAQQETSFKNANWHEAQAKVMNISKKYLKEIILFLFKDEDFPETVDQDVIKFFKKAKENFTDNDLNEVQIKSIRGVINYSIVNNLYEGENLEAYVKEVLQKK